MGEWSFDATPCNRATAGKCGTESAPKKCLRRQLVALQRAANGAGASDGEEPMDASPMAPPPPPGPPQGAAAAGGGGGGDDGGGGGSTPPHGGDERVAVAAAEQRARERARRETWSLPLGQGSGAAGRRVGGAVYE